MRILGKIPHPSFNIVAYTLEKHYYVEIEAGPMKQCYKLHKETTDGLEGIKQWLDADFLIEVKNLFNAMYANHSAALKRLGTTD